MNEPMVHSSLSG